MVKICYNLIMKVKRLEPVVIENFLKEREVELIYKNVDNLINEGLRESGDKYAKFFKFKGNGFITTYGPWHQHIRSLVKKKGEEFGQNEISDDNITLIFARYTIDSGSVPNLLPHIDVVANKTLYSASIRLRTTRDWDLYIKDTMYDLPHAGSAAWFTGNQDVHWRPDVDFGPDDYYDVLLVQVWSDIDNDDYEDDHRLRARQIEDEYLWKYKDRFPLSWPDKTFQRDLNTDCRGVYDHQTSDEAYEVAGYKL